MTPESMRRRTNRPLPPLAERVIDEISSCVRGSPNEPPDKEKLREAFAVDDLVLDYSVRVFSMLVFSPR